MDTKKPPKVHLVSSTDSPEFTLLNRALTRTSLVGLDAEWKPLRTHQASFPTVSLLQIACQLDGDSAVFLLDLFSVPLSSLWESLREMLVSPDVLKLGFIFKQDLIYLSSTFCSQGCEPGFDKVEPYLDIMTVYNHLQQKKHGRNVPKQIKSLSTICGEVLGFPLSKELQCSDWSRRPLTEEQITYAAMDAHCLLEIFKVFQENVAKEALFTQHQIEEPRKKLREVHVEVLEQQILIPWKDLLRYTWERGELEIILDMAESLICPRPLLAATHQQLIHEVSAPCVCCEDGDGTSLTKVWENSYGVKISDVANGDADSLAQLASEINADSKSGRQIGFIGLGAMGFGMATQLLGSNFNVVGYDVHKPTLTRFANARGLTGNSTTEVSKYVDVFILMVTNEAQAEIALYGEYGAVSILTSGALIILFLLFFLLM